VHDLHVCFWLSGSEGSFFEVTKVFELTNKLQFFWRNGVVISREPEGREGKTRDGGCIYVNMHRQKKFQNVQPMYAHLLNAPRKYKKGKLVFTVRNSTIVLRKYKYKYSTN
jgi:hypothetical protein